MEWYYAEGGEQKGPYSEEDFQRLIREGGVNPNTLVWRQGMADWQPFSAVAPAVASTPTQQADIRPDEEGPERSYGDASSAAAAMPAMATCAECGRQFAPTDMVEYMGQHVCGDCKDFYFQRVREGARLPTDMVYGGFWIRVVAKIIDSIVLWLVQSVIGYIFGMFVEVNMNNPAVAIGGSMALTMINFTLACGYVTFFLGRFGATPGKMACKLKVVTPEGDPISYWRAFGRYFAEILSGMILGIGYLMVAFDSEKRALHDHICGTRVIKTD